MGNMRPESPVGKKKKKNTFKKQTFRKQLTKLKSQRVATLGLRLEIPEECGPDTTF